MPRLTFAGHPVHPQLVGVPLGLLPMSLALDVAYLTSRKRSYVQASYYTMSAATSARLRRRWPGWRLLRDPGWQTKRIANVHLTLNVGIVGLASLNLLRRHGKTRLDGVDVAIAAIANTALLVSGWYGGQLVYRQGLRVSGRSEIAHSTEWRLPGDDKIEHALAAVPGADSSVEVPDYDGRSAARDVDYRYREERSM